MQMYLRRSPEEVEELKERGRRALRAACILLHDQLDRGGRVLLEQPWQASSWREPCVRALLARAGMARARGDVCAYGFVAKDAQGVEKPAMQPLGWATNSERVAEAVAGRCAGDHPHVHLIGGRAKGSE
eukprot:4131608-Lingulodinium_polyedra.AAC.1